MYAAKIQDPALAARFRSEAEDLKSAIPPIEVKRIPMTFDTSMAVKLKHAGEAREGHMTRPVLRVDDVKAKLDDQRKVLLDKYRPK